MESGKMVMFAIPFHDDFSFNSMNDDPYQETLMLPIYSCFLVCPKQAFLNSLQLDEDEALPFYCCDTGQD